MQTFSALFPSHELMFTNREIVPTNGNGIYKIIQTTVGNLI